MTDQAAKYIGKALVGIALVGATVACVLTGHPEAAFAFGIVTFCVLL